MKGWRFDSHRHMLAAKGISSKSYFSPVFITRESLGNKHRGDETSNERRRMYNMPEIVEPKGEGQEYEYMRDQILKDNGDINEAMLTDKDDYAIWHWKKGRGTIHPNVKDFSPREFEGSISHEDKRAGFKLVEDKEYPEKKIFEGLNERQKDAVRKAFKGRYIPTERKE